MARVNSARAYQQLKRHRQLQRKKTISIAMVVSGLFLLGATAFWIIIRQPGSVAFEYRPEDINYERPLHAVHEMEPPNLASIPFLPDGDPQPKILLPESFYNFGRVGPSDVVQQNFVIANNGDAPLTISRAYTTCGCTTADFTSTYIPPGQVTIMTLTFDAGFHDTAGQTVRRGVIIENNDPNNPQMEIWTEAQVSTG